MADLLHLVDKPEGWTSHDAVARLRRILGERRVGHAGTLDPFATGLLLVGEGRATGLLAALGLLPKRYLATVRLGFSTDTQDRTGAPLARSASRNPLPSLHALDDALARFRGPLEQTPPLYSAVKVAGERLYRAARRGEEVERSARPIHVYALERVSDASEVRAGAAPGGGATAADGSTVADGSTGALDIVLDATVSRGTYVRTLAHDLGDALGCGAHLAELRRVSIGPFHVEGAGLVEKGGGWDAARFRGRAVAPADALRFLPRVRLDAVDALRLRRGAAPTIGAERIAPGDGLYPLPPGEAGWPIALLDEAGALLALAEPWCAQSSDAPLRLQRVLTGPPNAHERASDEREAASA